MPPVKTSPLAQVLLARYSYQNRRVFTTKSRLDWLQRKAPRQRKSQTPAEKANRQANRSTHRAKLKTAINESMAVIRAQAESLAEQFPGHSAAYYFRLLMQQARKKGAQRRVNMWNAYLSLNKDRVVGKFVSFTA